MTIVLILYLYVVVPFSAFYRCMLHTSWRVYMWLQLYLHSVYIQCRHIHENTQACTYIVHVNAHTHIVVVSLWEVA